MPGFSSFGEADAAGPEAASTGLSAGLSGMVPDFGRARTPEFPSDSCPRLSGLIRLSHAALGALPFCREVCPVFLDATAGNGHDTLFLARLAGPGGRVVAMDCQREALDRTAARLTAAGLAERVQLLCGHHRDMSGLLEAFFSGQSGSAAAPLRLAGAVFNLGFLPGSDKSIATDARSTVTALDAVWPRLRAGGLLSVHVYTGHPGAREEAEAVADWMTALPWNRGQATSCQQHNKNGHQETLFLVYKADQPDQAVSVTPGSTGRSRRLA